VRRVVAQDQLAVEDDRPAAEKSVDPERALTPDQRTGFRVEGMYATVLGAEVDPAFIVGCGLEYLGSRIVLPNLGAVGLVDGVGHATPVPHEDLSIGQQHTGAETVATAARKRPHVLAGFRINAVDRSIHGGDEHSALVMNTRNAIIRPHIIVIPIVRLT